MKFKNLLKGRFFSNKKKVKAADEKTMEFLRALTSVVLKKIPEFTCALFSPEGILLGFPTYLELTNFQLEIQRKKFSGYYLIYNDEKIYINEDGIIEIWFKGFYDQQEVLMEKLLGV